MDQREVGLAVSRPLYPFRTHVARFRQARGWPEAVYFGLTGYIYLVKLHAI